MKKPSVRGEWFLWCAALVALSHAIPDLYWAFGGTLGLATLGAWAPEWRAEHPALVAIAMVGVFVAKVAGGVVPLLATRRLIPWRRMWRALSWAGAAVLIAYGGANVFVGGMALTGVIAGPDDKAERTALLGHVLLWDPLFLAWGLLLAAGLFATRAIRFQPVTPGLPADR